MCNFHLKYFILFTLFFYHRPCATSRIDESFEKAPKATCDDKTARKINRVLPLVMPLFSDSKIAETPIELRQWCNAVEKHNPFLFGYMRDCGSAMGRTVAKLTVFALKKSIEAVCKTGKPNKNAIQMLRAGKCGNEGKPLLKECQNKLIDALGGIASAPVKQRLPMVCCQANAMVSCIKESMEDTKFCTSEIIDWGEKWVLGSMGGALPIMCGEYFSDSDKCTKLIKDTPKIENKKARSSTFVMPLIELMESFPENPDS